MSRPLPPFSCTYSPNLPELLRQLNSTIAISTYQAGKVILISATDNDNLVQLPRNFQKPMGMAFKGNKMAVATAREVLVLANAPQMAPQYPKQKNTYDALFLPRSVYYTGAIDLHDLEWINDKLWAVNTLFSCLCTLDDEFSFKPQWKPSFISCYSPTDNCHLNGLAVQKGKPKFVTALGLTDTSEGWRKNKNKGGIVIDVDSGEIVSGQLPMPHSPRIYNGELYALLSATGELIKINIQTGKYEVVKRFDGFVRGMTKYNDYLFIGLSRLRKDTSSFKDLPIASRSIFCGIVVLHLPTAEIAGYLKYENSVDEIYDIKIIPGYQRPGLLNNENDDHRIALTSPAGDFWVARRNSTGIIGNRQKQ